MFNESTELKSSDSSGPNSTEKKSDLKSCLKNPENVNILFTKDIPPHSTNEDHEFGDDFKDLKSTSFFDLQNNLSKSENLITTFNVEYGTNSTMSQTIPNIMSQQQQQQNNQGLLSASISSTNNTSSNVQPPNYSRIPSFNNTNLKSCAATSAEQSSCKY